MAYEILNFTTKSGISHHLIAWISVVMSLILATPLRFETLVFEAVSSCFPKQIGGHLGKVTKMAEGEEWNTIQFGFLRF